jgi:hypothetical protein
MKTSSMLAAVLRTTQEGRRRLARRSARGIPIVGLGRPRLVSFMGNDDDSDASSCQ